MPHIVLLRSWSKRAAATKISAVHRVIKLLHFASSRSRGTISRKLTHNNKRGNCKDDDSDILGSVSEVKVKDISRWRSFGDLAAEDDPRPLIFSPSPHRSATASCSKRSSWCDSDDFTAEEGGEIEELSTLKNPKEDWSTFEEYEQQSPVLVLDSLFRQVQEFKHFHPILENIQKQKFPKKESTFMKREKGSSLSKWETTNNDEDVLMNFFIDELSRNENKLSDEEFDCEILRIAKS